MSSLPACVTNKTPSSRPITSLVAFVGDCTVCICLNVQLSCNYQASLLFVCSINLTVLL
jgi:hypothetical protein